MPAPQKRPTILVIDDFLAGSSSNRESVEKTIGAVASALGYDETQRTRIIESIKFFAQYDKYDGPLKPKQCAAHYLQNRNNNTEVPVLAFVDNNFAVGNGNRVHVNYHGVEAIAALQKEADGRHEIRPAIVWISSDDAPEIERKVFGKNASYTERMAKSHKFKVNLTSMPADTILNFARSPMAQQSPESPSNQTLIHSLRDAFEVIVPEGPAQKPWKIRLANPSPDTIKTL